MNVLTIIIIFAVLILIFLLVREFMCWYWKINDIVKILIRIESKLSNVTTNEFTNRSNKSFQENYQANDLKNSNVNLNGFAENEQSNSSINANHSADGELDSEQNLMKRYGITYENEKYHFKSYQYDNLENAVNYAKLCEERGIK